MLFFALKRKSCSFLSQTPEYRNLSLTRCLAGRQRVSEQQVYTGIGQAGKFSTPTNDPRRWVSQESGDYVVLMGLVDLLAELDEAMEILNTGERPPVKSEEPSAR